MRAIDADALELDTDYYEQRDVDIIGLLPSVEPQPLEDTISRQDAIDAINRIWNRCEEINAHLPNGDPDKDDYRMYPDYLTVWKYLLRLPTMQSEVICCKDCKHHHQYKCMDSMPMESCDLDQLFYDANIDFCSHAERREE